MIKLYHYNGTKLKDFYMGPSVKFVLPIIDAFPDQKNGGNFLCGKVLVFLIPPKAETTALGSYPCKNLAPEPPI